MKIRREGNFVFHMCRDGWRLYATLERGSWCVSSVDSIGQPQLNPLPDSEQIKLRALVEGKEVEL